MTFSIICYTNIYRVPSTHHVPSVDTGNDKVAKENRHGYPGLCKETEPIGYVQNI
jgi:hypothetical protein